MAARIYNDFTSVEVWDDFPSVEVKSENLQEGMVLLDPEIGTPVMGIDHKVPAARGSGNVSYYVADLENGGWTQLNLRKGITVQVIATG